MEPSPNTHRPSVHKARVGLATPLRVRKTKLHRIRSWPGPHVAERRQSRADTPVEGGGCEEGLSVVGGRSEVKVAGTKVGRVSTSQKSKVPGQAGRARPPQCPGWPLAALGEAATTEKRFIWGQRPTSQALSSHNSATHEPDRSIQRSPHPKTPGGTHSEPEGRASLVVHWLRICLLMQGTRARALAWEDPTCRRATGPVSHNY
ncbi:hypothetical protein J1605_009119 [Eschrichtius robustus]|uniref:Uncharacterized protein n=1 Tax=Eschrichtius robustus TaxID=9764 RepID=A0AB34GVA1_ESCRO|nr:hypothetical protein J1605_009119 [Eschrichtius robustus]